jgi:hypothetical protein
LQATVQDNWGNNYTWPPPSPLDVLVEVSKTKQNLALGSVAAASAGLSSTIFTFGIGAAVGGIIAQVLCGKAQDPPVPDPDYMTAAEIMAPPLPDVRGGEIELPKTAIFLELALRYTAIGGAISRTEAKLLGAQGDENADGTRLQISSYKRLHKELMSVAEQLPEALTGAVNEVTAKSSLSRERMNAKLYMWQAYGIPADVEKTWADEGLSSTTIATLHDRVTSGETLPPLSNSLLGLADSLILDAYYVTQDMREVIPPASAKQGKK